MREKCTYRVAPVFLLITHPKLTCPLLDGGQVTAGHLRDFSSFVGVSFVVGRFPKLFSVKKLFDSFMVEHQGGR